MKETGTTLDGILLSNPRDHQTERLGVEKEANAILEAYVGFALMVRQETQTSGRKWEVAEVAVRAMRPYLEDDIIFRGLE